VTAPKTKWRGSLALRILSYAILGTAVITTVDDLFRRTEILVPRDMGILLGNGNLFLLGLVTSVVATTLHKLEGRLDKIEEKGD
jgi:hypothetical protein